MAAFNLCLGLQYFTASILYSAQLYVHILTGKINNHPVGTTGCVAWMFYTISTSKLHIEKG